MEVTLSIKPDFLKNSHKSMCVHVNDRNPEIPRQKKSVSQNNFDSVLCACV